MADISTLTIASTSKTGKKANDYKEYLTEYRNFAAKKRNFAPKSTLKVDSQFSERLAADYFKFDVNHSKGLDGIDPITNDTYEVKACGFSNNKVRFNPNNKAMHVIWIKVKKKKIEIYEVDVDIYNHLDSNGFVDIYKKMKQITKAEFTY